MTTTSGDRERDFVDFLEERWERAFPGKDRHLFGIVMRIQRAAVFINARQEDLMRHFGIKYGDFLVLAALRRSLPDCSLNPTELFKSLLITSGAITKRVDRLTGMGLVERRADPKDRRGVLVYLTEPGRKLMDRILAVPDLSTGTNRFRELVDLSDQEREELSRLLRKVMIGFERRPFRSMPPEVKMVGQPGEMAYPAAEPPAASASAPPSADAKED